MGKTRIATFREPSSAKATEGKKASGPEGLPARRERHKKSLKKLRGVRAPGLKGGERVVAVVAELPETPQEPSTARASEGKKKVARPPKKRGKHYLAARAKVEPGKLYPIAEAVKLARQTSISSFPGKLELHLVLTKTGAFEVDGQKISTEVKTPLLHAVVGKLSDKESVLTENLEKILKAFGEKNIKKAVVAATMGPGIRVDIGKVTN